MGALNCSPTAHLTVCLSSAQSTPSLGPEVGMQPATPDLRQGFSQALECHTESGTGRRKDPGSEGTAGWGAGVPPLS